jgi:hypothetical protein
MFRNRLDRTVLTLNGALIALVVGFAWSRDRNSWPIAKQAKGASSGSSG